MPAAEALAPRASARSDTAGRLRLALVWGGAGFAAGATFWHLVGFWAFLSQVVLDRAPEAHAALASAVPPGLSQSPVVLVDADRCTSLTRDPRANETLARPCPSDGLALRVEADGAAREDLSILAQPPLLSAGYRAD